MKMSRTKICLAALAAVSMCAVFAADGGKTASLAEARGGIGEAISSPEAMESAMNSLSAADQVAFLGEVNAAIAKRQASKEEKAAMFLKANGAITSAISLVGTIILYYLAVKSRVSPSEYIASSRAAMRSRTSARSIAITG